MHILLIKHVTENFKNHAISELKKVKYSIFKIISHLINQMQIKYGLALNLLFLTKI